jgi:hypothetical protein
MQREIRLGFGMAIGRLLFRFLSLLVGLLVLSAVGLLITRQNLLAAEVGGVALLVSWGGSRLICGKGDKWTPRS